jgi:hypothetical protein
MFSKKNSYSSLKRRRIRRTYKNNSKNINTTQITWEDRETTKWTQRGFQQTPKWNQGYYF